MWTHGYKSNVSEVAGIDPDDSVIENENKCGVNEVICYILYFQALYTTQTDFLQELHQHLYC